MIYIYTFTQKEINYFCEDLLNFFPVSIQDSKISILVFVESEDKVKNEILKKLFNNSLYVSGLRRQCREKIDFNLPIFDYVFDLNFYGEEDKDISAYDLICNANVILKNDLLDAFQFINSLKKYRIYKKYGKEYNLKEPFLWDVFSNGIISEKYANYILGNSNFVAIPNIGVQGIGELAVNFIYQKDFCFISFLKELTKNEKINLLEISRMSDLPYF